MRDAGGNAILSAAAESEMGQGPEPACRTAASSSEAGLVYRYSRLKQVIRGVWASANAFSLAFGLGLPHDGSQAWLVFQVYGRTIPLSKPLIIMWVLRQYPPGDAA